TPIQISVMSISASDLIQYKGHYGDLIEKTNCLETRAVIAALAYGSLTDIPEERMKELPQEVLDYLSRVSLVNAVTTHGRTLSYDLLLSHLRLPSDSSLESLVIDAIYEGVCQATMDSAARTITVSSWSARECDPSKIGSMVSILDQWMNRSTEVISQASKKAEEEDSKLAAEREQEKMIKDELLAARVAMEEEYKEGGFGKGGGRSNSRATPMQSLSEMLMPLGSNNGRMRQGGGRFRGGRTGK
ncbi:hypothetical protein PENTCL1PPCAC_21215, partial [Pristionchus entomophagus]